MLPKPLEELQKIFEAFPGIGPRQSSRFVFFLMKQPKEEIDKIIHALNEMKKEVRLCRECYLPAGSVQDCFVCSDLKRDKNIVYVVEKESDALNMESAKILDGVYFVLGENISPMQGLQTAKERAKDLVRRVKKHGGGKEIVLALNNTREGNFTALYVEELLKENFGGKEIKITRLGRGLSTGSELEYSDEETLRNALENRR
ncbi:MAG: recombination mediator RecR [Candidatus Spechtbacterales bacterium]